MKKIFIMLTILLLFSSCKLKISDKLKDTKSSSHSIAMNNDSTDKFNTHIDFYSILSKYFNNQINSYILEFGKDKELKINSDEPSFVASDIKPDIESFTNSIGKESYFANLDEKAKELLPILEKLNDSFIEASQYYKGGDYREDNYKKGKELHTKIIALIYEYYKVYDEYEEELKKSSKLQHEKELEVAEKSGNKIAVGNLKTSIAMNEIMDELSKEQLNGSNFTEKGDASKLQQLYDKFVIAQEELRKAANNPDIVKKYDFDESYVESYVNSVIEFKRSTYTLINRIKNKQKTSDFNIERAQKYGQMTFLENDEGTPENLYKKFNEAMDNYNKVYDYKL